MGQRLIRWPTWVEALADYKAAVKFTFPESHESVCPLDIPKFRCMCHTPENVPRRRLSLPESESVPPVRDTVDPAGPADGGTATAAFTRPPFATGSRTHPSGNEKLSPDVQLKSSPVLTF